MTCTNGARSVAPYIGGIMSTLRNRHTIENDIKTALIKRINRAMKKKNSRIGGIWKVKVGTMRTCF